jgi:DNA-binding NtrC family response regulator
MAHSWPGNVRELRNVVERAVILESTPEVQATSLPDFELEQRLRKASNPASSSSTPNSNSLGDALVAFERQIILDALAQNDFNLNRAAQHLEITRHALRYRMSRLNITLDTIVDEDSDAAASSSAR